MKKTNEIIKKFHKKPMADLGIRFLVFRKAIKKKRLQLAEELNIRLSEITAIEKGTLYPKINYLHYLNRTYGLNINWIIGNVGEMFIKDHPMLATADPDYIMKPPLKNGEAVKKMAELLNLMQVPVIEETLMAKLREIKQVLKEGD